MPLKENELLTKLRGVRSFTAQQCLRHIREENSPVRTEIRSGSLYVQVPYGNVRLGEFKPSYAPFLDSLRYPDVELEVTGGGYRLTDTRGNCVREFSHFDQLTASEEEMLRQGRYKYYKLQYGCNVAVRDLIATPIDL